MPKVFIIVLHYKNWKDTQSCLKSLEALNYDNFEVIVVDNSPEDNFQLPITNFQLTRINNKKNLGFAGGNNIGIKQAIEKAADYVLLLNNDTVVDRNFLKELVEVGESDKKAGILGPIIYEYQSDKIHFAGGKINWLYTKGIHISTKRSPAPYGAGRSDQPFQPSSVNEVDYITGACMLVKRGVIEKIGLMPEEYFLYLEDVDWCLKARRAGYKCVLVSDSKIWHKVSSSAKAGSFSYIYYHYRNGLLLAKKNAPFFIKILAYLNSFLVYAKQIIKLVIFPKNKKWAKAIMRGIGDFYKGKFGKLTK